MKILMIGNVKKLNRKEKWKIKRKIFSSWPVRKDKREISLFFFKGELTSKNLFCLIKYFL